MCIDATRRRRLNSTPNTTPWVLQRDTWTTRPRIMTCSVSQLRSTHCNAHPANRRSTTLGLTMVSLLTLLLPSLLKRLRWWTILSLLMATKCLYLFTTNHPSWRVDALKPLTPSMLSWPTCQDTSLLPTPLSVQMANLRLCLKSLSLRSQFSLKLRDTTCPPAQG